MDNRLPFFNWSLKKAQDIEPDNLNKARILIVFTILLFSLLKTVIVVGIGAAHAQWLQVGRAAIAFLCYLVFVKVLLYKPATLKVLAHIMIWFGIAIVWTNIFIYAHKVNLPSIQFVFMVMLSGFYALGSVWGFTYSAASVLPVVLFMVFHGNQSIYVTDMPQEFASPGLEIIVLLNFITIAIAHYLFFDAFRRNAKEKEELNQQLQLSAAEANRLAETKSNFLSTMSHELRTPLSSVIGIADLLLEDKPEERQKEKLKLLRFSAMDLLSLINNILDFNKLDYDKLELEAIPFDLAEFMQNICSVLRVKAGSKKISLVLDIDDRLKTIQVCSDPTRLSQVMYNLIGNALKFTDKGGITVKLALVGKRENIIEVMFSIADTGIGIPADKHETIFELFAQAGTHTARTHGGTGLGLPIVKQTLQLFNSSIQLESSPGNGSKFFFTIPFTIAAEKITAKSQAPADTQDLSHLRILIAEDDDVNRMIMEKQLAVLNVKPVMVHNGREAYEACVAGNFDAVFMDLNMPEQGGYETLHLIRALENAAKANIFVVAFTASVTEQQKILQAGFNDYLYKPVNLGELRKKLEKILLHATPLK
jgi:two-component system, sensor histidine kinase